MNKVRARAMDALMKNQRMSESVFVASAWLASP